MSGCGKAKRESSALEGGTAFYDSIAVVIPCYNQARFLRMALDSVLAQTRAVDEIIVVDDGSDDDVAGACVDIPRLRYLRQHNAGPSAARNLGLAAISSRRVLFLDADDTLFSETLAQANDALDRETDATFAFGGYREIDEVGQTRFEHWPVDHEDAYAGLLAGNHIATPSAVLFDVGRLRGINGFDSALRGCEDYDVFLKLARKHPPVTYPYIAATYRQHGANASSDTLKMIRTSQIVLGRQIALGLSRPRQKAARAGLITMQAFYLHMASGQGVVTAIRAVWLILVRSPIDWALSGRCLLRVIKTAIAVARNTRPDRHSA